VATAITLKGLKQVQTMLGRNYKPAMRAATRAIAEQVKSEIAPYPPSTQANSPTEDRWYERGYGPKWHTKSGVHGTRSSQTLGRRWGVAGRGAIGAVLSNIATYAPFVHAAAKQARWMKKINWKTDEWAIRKVMGSGIVQKVMTQAIMRVFRR